MRYVVEIASRQVATIRELINAGHFESVQQFIEVAIENQLFLQSLPPDIYPDKPVAQHRKTEPLTTQMGLLGYEDKFLLLPHRDPPFTEEHPYTQRKTLWGLHNRIFPGKIALRVIANLAVQSEEAFVDFLQVREEASKRARFIGRLLADDDEKAGRLHGQKLSTGLPTGPHDKAIARYQNMFVGFRKSKGNSGGLLVDLGFVVIKNAENGRIVIALTKVGADFARLANPILDVRNLTTDVALSEEEAEFYLSHIGKWLPLELLLYQEILDAVSSGKNKPKELDFVVKANLENLKENVLATERAGMISRLTELSMLGRKRKGLNVSYILTSRGQQFLKRLKEAKAGS